MNCARCREELVAYLDEQLGPVERSELDSHLAGCADCRAALDRQRRLSDALGALPAVAPRPDFEARFWARLAREREAPAGWRARFFTRRFALGLGGAVVAAIAAVLALRGPTESDVDLQIVANSEDYELLEDPDLDLIEVVDTLEDFDGDPDGDQPG